MRTNWLPAVLFLAVFRAAAAVDFAFLDTLLRMRSVSADIPACNRACETTANYLKGRGVFCTMLETQQGRRVLYASTMPGNVHDFVLVTHLDVVPGTDAQFTPVYRDGRIFARGALDTKGNVAAILDALVTLAGKASVGAVFATDEEIGGSTARHAVQSGFLPRRFVLVGDGAGQQRRLITAEKGHLVFHLVAKGRGGHSSMPWELDNPVPRLARGYLKLLDALPPPQDDGSHWCNFLSATQLEGGKASNQIPDAARMTFSYRYVEFDASDKLLALAKATSGLDVEVVRDSKPFTSDPGAPLIRSLFAEMKKRWPDVAMDRMNAATDARHYAHLGLPIAIFSVDGEGAHAAVESCIKDSVQQYADLLIDFIWKETAGKPPESGRE
ncbi:MAG: M20/M25/M40 family metallo-hydrolase [Kiritimatiellae bacterium]|nr:M20/M25/M40 family metallo-hydrolase [Kiritimatiellia bacterium]